MSGGHIPSRIARPAIMTSRKNEGCFVMAMVTSIVFVDFPVRSNGASSGPSASSPRIVSLPVMIDHFVGG